jgi:hypothetical protein
MTARHLRITLSIVTLAVLLPTATDRGQQPVKANSTADNLRPLVPKWKDARTALVWMRGPSYTNNHGSWTTAVVALILPPK